MRVKCLIADLLLDNTQTLDQLGALARDRRSKKPLSRSALRARCVGITREHNVVHVQA